MDAASKLTRRHFIVTAATVAGGFAIGISAARSRMLTMPRLPR